MPASCLKTISRLVNGLKFRIPLFCVSIAVAVREDTRSDMIKVQNQVTLFRVNTRRLVSNGNLLIYCCVRFSKTATISIILCADINFFSFYNVFNKCVLLFLFVSEHFARWSGSIARTEAERAPVFALCTAS